METQNETRLFTAELQQCSSERLEAIRTAHPDAGTRRRAKRILKARGVPIVGPGRVEGRTRRPLGRHIPSDAEAAREEHAARQVDEAVALLTAAGWTIAHTSPSGSVYLTSPAGTPLRLADHAVPENEWREFCRAERDGQGAWDNEIVFRGRGDVAAVVERLTAGP